LNKSSGLKAERLSTSAGVSQAGLFKMQLVTRVGSTPEDVSKAKYGKKGRIGTVIPPLCFLDWIE